MIEFLWQTNEKSADYSFNKSHAACYALIAYRTAWLKANYTGRVHGGADLLGDVDQGQGARSSSPAARRWASRSCRRTSTSQTTSSPSSERQHPLRPGRGQGRRLPGGRGDQARARGGRRVHLAVGLLRARGQPHGQQEGDRGADQVRRARLDRREPQGHARGARAGAGGRPEDPAGRADRPGLDLRPAGRRSPAPAGGRRGRAGARPRRARSTRRSPPRSSSRPSCWRSRRKRSGCSSPRIR